MENGVLVIETSLLRSQGTLTYYRFILTYMIELPKAQPLILGYIP